MFGRARDVEDVMKLSERMEMGREAAPWCIERVKLLERALDAANDFIESHVADPDITDEMILNYRIYKAALATLEDENNGGI